MSVVGCYLAVVALQLGCQAASPGAPGRSSVGPLVTDIRIRGNQIVVRSCTLALGAEHDAALVVLEIASGTNGQTWSRTLAATKCDTVELRDTQESSR